MNIAAQGAPHGTVMDETRLTRMFITLVCVFVIGELPSALLSRGIVVAFVGENAKKTLDSKGYQIASMIATVLVVTQHSVNFIIYSVLNTKFTRAFQSAICACTGKRMENNNLTMVTYHQTQEQIQEEELLENGNDISTKSC